MLYGSCNDSEWWLAFIMHNLYTKLRILGVVTDYHHVHTYIHITMGSKLTWNRINTQWYYSLMNMRQIHIFFKVRIFWKGHKIWKNLPLKIWRYWVASKGYLPNLLETALLCQIFVFWVRDLTLWLLAYFLTSFNCANFEQDWTTLILDILYFW